jgi:serine/threonine protein kinase
MALSPGTRLGVYEVTAQIGEGGMGQVFRAHDTRLNRDVALKILPDAVASDPDRLARFTREVQTLASLNLAQIYGLEESGSPGYGSRSLARHCLMWRRMADPRLCSRLHPPTRPSRSTRSCSS